MAFSAAHSEEAVPLQPEHLAAEQMDHMGPDALYLSAVPVLHRILCQKVEILVVTGYEQQREGQLLQPVQTLLFLFSSVPYPAKVPADDHIVILGHGRLLGEIFLPKAFKVAVGIPSRVDHTIPPSSL